MKKEEKERREEKVKRGGGIGRGSYRGCERNGKYKEREAGTQEIGTNERMSILKSEKKKKESHGDYESFDKKARERNGEKRTAALW